MLHFNCLIFLLVFLDPNMFVYDIVTCWDKIKGMLYVARVRRSGENFHSQNCYLSGKHVGRQVILVFY
jgi:hypothetical protein